MRVLLFSRYRPLVKPLARGLEEEGFRVDVADGGDGATSGLRTAAYDAIVLDLFPPEAGLALLRDWRGAGLKTPVLVLTAPGSTEELLPVLDAGADDWLSKPFALDDLFARLRALADKGQ
jgi:DNA-binding response OmpR family regulator